MKASSVIHAIVRSISYLFNVVLEILHINLHFDKEFRSINVFSIPLSDHPFLQKIVPHKNEDQKSINESIGAEMTAALIYPMRKKKLTIKNILFR